MHTILRDTSQCRQKQAGGKGATQWVYGYKVDHQVIKFGPFVASLYTLQTNSITTAKTDPLPCWAVLRPPQGRVSRSLGPPALG